MKHFTCVLLTLFVTATGFAASVGDFPGSIPLDLTRRPATDLIYKNKTLLPDQAFELHKQGEVDISTLNPDETSGLWKNKDPEPLDPELDDINVLNNDEVEFLSEVSSGSGRYRMSVRRINEVGVPETFTIMMSKKIHNVLLRKAVLRKLGYHIPAIKYLSNVKVKIGPATRKSALDRISLMTAGDPARWVTNSKDEDSRYLNLQDVVVFKNDNIWQNLAMGYLPASFIKGRRILNSLLIPYNLVEVPESVNLFAWHPGRIIDGYVHLPYERSDDFSTPLNDAKWMIRRILKLTRNDFIEIAKASHTPKVVQSLLIEKLISRRNFYIQYFKLTNYKMMSFNSSISEGAVLKNGKLLKENWDGYGSRFAFGDPDSPLSGSEIKAFFKSKFISNIFSNLVTYINDEYLPKINVEEKFYERQLDLAKDRFINFIRTGNDEKTPFGIWTTPTASGRIIASRDIVVGSYMGADNSVQLADAVGFSVDAGVYFSAEGLPVQWVGSGTGKVFFTRTYTHLKPIKSMKMALKDPFKNIMVPMLKRKYGKIFDKAVSSELEGEEQQKLITEAVNEFKKNLGVGESILIQDSLGAGLNVNVGYKVSTKVRAYAQFLTNQKTLSRLHIIRAGEDTIQIYKDLGNVNTLGLSFGIKNYIPVLGVTLKLVNGKAKTRFHSVSIDDDTGMNPDILHVITALRELLTNNSLEMLNTFNDPYVLKYKFKETSSDINFFHWRWLNLDSKNKINLTTPENYELNYIRRTDGKRHGVDYQQLTVDVLNSLIEEVTEDDIIIGTVNSGNPGDTIFGKSFFRQATFESELHGKNIDKSYTNITYKWKGWEITRKKAEKIIEDITDKYNFSFYPDTIFNETKKLQLYSIDVSVNIYEQGLLYLSTMNSTKISDIFNKHCHKRLSRRDTLIKKYKRAKSRYLRYTKKGNPEKATEYLLKMANIAEKSLDLEGLIKIVGGKDNIYIFSKIQGFRAGDENGDRSIMSSGIGRFGDENHFGPLHEVRTQIGMGESEFFLHWILRKL